MALFFAYKCDITFGSSLATTQVKELSQVKQSLGVEPEQSCVKINKAVADGAHLTFEVFTGNFFLKCLLHMVNDLWSLCYFFEVL